MGALNVSKVQKVALDEIKQARESADFSAAKTSAENAKMAYENFSYVAKIKDSEIKKFFKNYGYLSHEKFQDESGKHFIRVCCENFDAIFSDFEVAIKCFPEYFTTQSNFNFFEFDKYCKAIDVSPEQAIADIITTDFLTKRFPSYAEARNKHKDENATSAFVNLPKEMKFLLRSVQEKTMAVNKLEGNKGRFGSFDADAYKVDRFGDENNG